MSSLDLPPSQRALNNPRPGEGIRLDELSREIPGGHHGSSLVGDGNVRLFGVKHDSRAVMPGDLFIARKGANSDGTKFIEDAKARGAVAVLTEKSANVSVNSEALGIPILFVDDLTTAFAHAAAAVYGHPSFGLDIVGITGTNGKTTTTHLVRAAIDGVYGSPTCGIIGTTGHRLGNDFVAAEHTTPEADELARVFASMRERRASHVAMEVSSIALVLGRTRAVRFRVAAFTNLTQDHLDFHGSMESYAHAKELLFTSCGPGSAVVNVDDVFGKRLVSLVRAPLIRVSARPGTSDHDADIAPRWIKHVNERSSFGTEILLRTPEGDVKLESPLVGSFNVENLVLAMGIVHALELDLGRAADALAAESGAPGRLERCDSTEDDIVVLVDYAHTPDALARVLESVSSLVDRKAGKRLLCVFGCGGDRDMTKRIPMGEAAGKHADVAVLTSDNPRTENPVDIASEVEKGLKRSGGKYSIELDRSMAIRSAVLSARKGDVIVVAGKGHENYQIVGTQKREFDDRSEAKRALEMRRGERGA